MRGQQTGRSSDKLCAKRYAYSKVLQLSEDGTPSKGLPFEGYVQEQGTRRLINIDANTHDASAFQLTEPGNDVSQDSYNSVQDRVDEWNSYYF